VRGELADLLQDLQSVHPRQPEVEQGNVGAALVEEAQGGDAVIRIQRFVARVRQQVAQERAPVGRLLGHQDSARARNALRHIGSLGFDS